MPELKSKQLFQQVSDSAIIESLVTPLSLLLEAIVELHISMIEPGDKRDWEVNRRSSPIVMAFIRV